MEDREAILYVMISEAFYKELVFESRQHLNDKEPVSENGGKSTGVEITSKKARIKDDHNVYYSPCFFTWQHIRDGFMSVTD